MWLRQRRRDEWTMRFRGRAAAAASTAWWIAAAAVAVGLPVEAQRLSPRTDDDDHYYEPWLCAVVASLTIGLSGVLPLILVRPSSSGASRGRRHHNRAGVPAKTLRRLLSFAVGGLLGDVFLHLLPEAWHHMAVSGGGGCHTTVGLWVLAGVLTFIILEMMFEKTGRDDDDDRYRHVPGRPNGVAHGNGHVAACKKFSTGPSSATEASRNVTGYLNLLANSIDNFTHGLAVAGSFLVSFKVGLLTTFAILVHEIPHEIGDFAILLKSGFSRLEAAKAQMATASVGLVGAVAALSVESTHTLGERTAWILPFTAGGFLNIALVNVLPDILRERDPKESVTQLGCLLAGIAVMALVTLFIG